MWLILLFMVDLGVAPGIPASEESPPCRDCYKRFCCRYKRTIVPRPEQFQDAEGREGKHRDWKKR